MRYWKVQILLPPRKEGGQRYNACLGFVAADVKGAIEEAEKAKPGCRIDSVSNHGPVSNAGGLSWVEEALAHSTS